MAEEPVATVKIIKICRYAGGEAQAGGYFSGERFANVQIVEIFDEAAFKEAASKISKDGQRANIDFSREEPVVGETYPCYAIDSLRGQVFAGKWDKFSYNWRNTTITCFIWSSLIVLFWGMFVYIRQQPR